ncbi:conserved hypothetical protein [Leishmania major strain Friedlin]|uniref:Uncharacterized protein n=1 Tax=Leishmania major TaxID=5664 RepID=Q4Q5P7_LEIMA|nr:conserved hypothetical protein [Leishmania major strain Friedlin]CAG9579990.1 hypothetical_protein_-_conserved [Leishmania major strain Friedlin]CAJ08504.1 conserved hypothetical protein [Leishmania major strain Friedlin]|eukprot:XP_001685351.1 conserved hypothetical protein [Leishmania major strain Friedlin]
MGPHSFRRCPVCIPEQAELQEADLLALQQRCEEARVADRRWRSALTHVLGSRGHRGGGRNSYQSNTAEMLRRQRNSFYQRAVDDEYMARRRMLQAELDARRNEIVKTQRARETLRMEAALSDAREDRRRSCGPRACSLQRARSADPAAGACLSTPPPQRKEQPPSLPSHSKDSDHAVPPSTQPKIEYPEPLPKVEKRPLPPPPTHPGRESLPQRQHRERVCSHGPAPLATCCADFHNSSAHGQWHWGWIWCPSFACQGHHSSQSPRNHVRLPRSPPACEVPMPSLDVEPTSRLISPTTGGDAASGHAKPEKSLECLERDAAAGAPTNPPQPSSAVSAAGADFAAACRAGKGRPECVRGGSSQFRSHSATSVPLTSPRFGRKVFITDDVYCDRRARYIAEWEASGAVQRVPASSRSPSAPFPEKTPKWRTTGNDAFTE